MDLKIHQYCLNIKLNAVIIQNLDEIQVIS